jgi:hypothetical protein
MRRRDVFALLIVEASRPLIGRAQPRSRRVGLLGTTSDADPGWPIERAAFVEAMSAFGWNEGDNLHVSPPATTQYIDALKWALPPDHHEEERDPRTGC